MAFAPFAAFCRSAPIKSQKNNMLCVLKVHLLKGLFYSTDVHLPNDLADALGGEKLKIYIFVCLSHNKKMLQKPKYKKDINVKMFINLLISDQSESPVVYNKKSV